MADDTRQSNAKIGSKSADSPKRAGKKDDSVTVYAGDGVRQATLFDAFKSMRLSHALEFYKKPCPREALLVGIGSAFTIGSLRAIMRGELREVVSPKSTMADIIQRACGTRAVGPLGRLSSAPSQSTSGASIGGVENMQVWPVSET